MPDDPEPEAVADGNQAAAAAVEDIGELAGRIRGQVVRDELVEAMV